MSNARKKGRARAKARCLVCGYLVGPSANNVHFTVGKEWWLLPDKEQAKRKVVTCEPCFYSIYYGGEPVDGSRFAAITARQKGEAKMEELWKEEGQWGGST